MKNYFFETVYRKNYKNRKKYGIRSKIIFVDSVFLVLLKSSMKIVSNKEI